MFGLLGGKKKEKEATISELEKLKGFGYPLAKGESNSFYLKGPCLHICDNSVTSDNIVANIEDMEEADILRVMDKFVNVENSEEQAKFICDVITQMNAYPAAGKVKVNHSNKETKSYPILSNTRCVYSVKETCLEFWHYIGLYGKVTEDLANKSGDEIREIIITKVNIADCVEKEEFIEDVIQYVGATDMANEDSVKPMSFF